jgi:predicted small lipoprotein YifL
MARATSCILTVCLAAALLAGCGNKGKLVLPDQPQPKKHKKAEPATDQKTPAPKPADPNTTTQPSGNQGSGNTDGQH